MVNHHRHTIRLKGYDYTLPGAYHIVMCTHHKECIFGKVIQEELTLNSLGKIAENKWLAIPTRFHSIELDVYAIMPNHIHVLLWIKPDVQQTHGNKEEYGHPVSGSIATIVRAYKSSVTQTWALGKPYQPGNIWQRNYYEHIIRNDRDLIAIRDYIRANPIHWVQDEYHPPT